MLRFSAIIDIISGREDVDPSLEHDVIVFDDITACTSFIAPNSPYQDFVIPNNLMWITPNASEVSGTFFFCGKTGEV
jgi:hypothetical protein